MQTSIVQSASREVALDQPPRADKRVRLRAMRESDLGTVTVLERMGYRHPWPRWWFRRLLRGDYSCWVADDGLGIVGYGIMHARPEWKWAHIMNDCVAPNLRRHGIGARIMRHLMEMARHQSRVGAWLEVRPNNAEALRLYRRLGFRIVGRRRHYYRDRWGRTDATVMVYRHPE